MKIIDKKTNKEVKLVKMERNDSGTMMGCWVRGEAVYGTWFGRLSIAFLEPDEFIIPIKHKRHRRWRRIYKQLGYKKVTDYKQMVRYTHDDLDHEPIHRFRGQIFKHNNRLMMQELFNVIEYDGLKWDGTVEEMEWDKEDGE